MAAVYEIITDRIIDLLDKGIVPWQRPWTVEMPMNLVSKKPYRGVNILMLSWTDFKSPYWLTYKQALDLKGNVKKGAKGIPVVFWHFMKAKAEGSDEDIKKSFPFMRYFNVEQCEGIPVPQDNKAEIEPIEKCERVINRMPHKPKIFHGGNKACYYPSKDTVAMPVKESFHSIERYYGTAFHELVHSTGHVSRLNRKGINDISAFGSETYSKEELIAEIGASFLCGITGIENQTISNQASYVGSWLSKLRNDKKLIITAASQAQKAADYIMNRKEDSLPIAA